MIFLSGFRVGELLYQGPKSQVYRARRDRDGLPVVLKIPATPEISIRENLRFQHEYDLLSSLQLSRVIKVYDLLQYRTSFAIVEEDFGACDLAHHIEGRRLAPREFLDIAVQMAEALAQLHGQHIIHKDVHLANFLIHPETGVLKLTDFGLSSLIEDEVQEPENPNQIEGNLYFIAPEQSGRMNRGIDSRSDLYSLGVCFYRMLTGELPFTSRDPMELLHAHIARRPVRPHELNPAVPAALSALTMRLLEKMAEDRYQSATGLLHDLETMRTACASGASLFDIRLGQRDVSSQFQVSQKLYGREPEVRRLLDTFERVAGGGAELLLVGGYSGIGKTALVNEVHKGLTRQRGRFISGKHDQFQRSIPFSAFIQAFRQLSHQILSEPEAMVTEWRMALLAALGPNAQVILDVIPEMEHILGPQPPVPDLGPSEAQNRFILCLQRFIGVFARPEHPLVIFLDDLQWADVPSLHLLQKLVGGTDATNLLLLGAYRDNEVSPGHPLMLAARRLHESGVTVHTVTLTPLDFADLCRLVADTLHRPPLEVEELTLLIKEKTGGNPFFVSQMLKELHTRGLFQLDPESGVWVWDMDGIRAMGLTDNVVDLMAGKIGRMAPQTRQALQLAACIGNRFTLPMLAAIHEKSQAHTSEALWEALQAGLLIPSGATFRFLHDRVQQAAYSLIAQEDIAPLHLRIGRLLLRHVGHTQLDDAIFDIVAHFNAALDLVLDPEERLLLLDLNMQAGRKAKASTAYEPALHHFEVAASLMPADGWRTHARTMLDVVREKADVSYLLGDFAQAEALLDQALLHTADRFDKVEVYIQKLIQSNQLGKYNELMDIARDALALFGVDLPQADDAATLARCFAAQMQDYTELLAGRPIAELIHVPDVKDRDQDSIIQLMAILTDGAYIAVPTLFPHLVMDVVTRSMRHGHNALSAIGFAWATVVIVQQQQDYRSAFALGTLSMQLIERFPNPRIQAQITFLYAVCAMHWFLPLADQIEMYKRAYQYGLENGNLVFAGYARTMIPKTVLAASTVDNALEENDISVAFYEKRGSPFYMSERFYSLFLHNLKGEGADPVSLSTPEIDEHAFLTHWQHPDSLFGHGLAYFLTCKLQLLFYFGKTAEAWRFAEAHASWMQYIPILYETTVFSFFCAMAAAELLETTSGTSAGKEGEAARSEEQDEERPRMRARFAASLSEFAVWAENCPENFAWQERLLHAEQARLTGRPQDALELYAQAAEVATRHGHPQGVALARERAALVLRQRGDAEAARAFFEDASFNYYQWGAHAKVLMLRQEIDTCATPGVHSLLESHTLDNSRESNVHYISPSQLLDIGSILKATQAISSEIHQDALLQVIMTSVIENAGAEHGFLLLPSSSEGQDWSVAAMATVEGQQPLDNSPLAGSTLVSEAIARFVIRSRQEIVLHDAGQHPTFQRDPHVVRKHVRSVLCMPLLSQNRLSGVLYLENNLNPGVFAIDRAQTVKMLAAQAAISIENANLYARLVASEQRYRSIFEDASDLIFLTTIDGRVVDVNPACLGMLGYTREELLSLTMADLYVDPQQRVHFQRTIEAVGTVRGFEVKLRRKGGERIEAILAANLRRDAQGRSIGYQGILHDVTATKQAERLREAYSQDLERQVQERTQELSEANDKLQWLSDHDGLTGIANRRKFDAALHAEWNRALRSASPLTLALVDVDNFKAYNDHMGHLRGDDCLRQVAQTLAARVRQSCDLAARYGGEEFAVLLPGLGAASALAVASKLCASIMELGIPHGKSPTADVVTVSMGVATCFPTQALHPEALVQAADANLYQAKRQGRNRAIASSLGVGK
ncbi:diguanylate cyclase domain-containing protein [Megalodesulfovibrio gigas]|uniref:Putative diguanylate cyclase/phosphodiesterase with PAS/PAC and GAF sensor(S) n=1 Tax=Megalodesulfovibrio gigas (strain ATCC 19364 / DSM 1382 / NCIMB 9332 / VKM B-1759) TaxID=1121448 RepID=T2GEV4_MEGG1|nr:diguanylate cyclase [Megalodesulfovibrio gigas]AGW15100.1 putative diguanylate cyclase/phosphodiesterase with PAS/PAC and GAF sensor(s) [Megalodesulfovibrio gigas DSM 1382 = ATCC 19364]